MKSIFKVVLYICAVTIIAACSGSTDFRQAKQVIPEKKTFKLLGGELVINNVNDDQQNPQAIYLPDKQIYFVVWEDWRNRNSVASDDVARFAGSEIFGRFLNADGTACGSEFSLTKGIAGNQTAPTVAYRPGDKVVVAWQDTEGTATAGYIRYASVTTIPSFASCGTVPTVSAPVQVGFTHFKQFGLSLSNSANASFTITGDASGGTDVSGGAVLTPYVEPRSIRIVGLYPAEDGLARTAQSQDVTVTVNAANKTFTRATGSWIVDGFAVGNQVFFSGVASAGNNNSFTISALTANTITCSTAVGLVDEGPVLVSAFVGTPTSVNIQDDGLGKLIGSGATGTINYMTGNLDVTLINEVDTDAKARFSISYNSLNDASTDTSELLLSRKSPKIVYESAKNQFALTWIESRNVNSFVSKLCFGVAPVTWVTGDSTFLGYLYLTPTLAPIANPLAVAGPDTMRSEETTSMKLVSTSKTATLETYIYDYFTNANNLNLASDTSSPETLFVWEGERNKATLTCQLDTATGTITSTFTTGFKDDGKVHIYGMFDKEIILNTVTKWLDFENTGSGTNPSLAVDSISSPKKFLVAWEDNRLGANTKVFGQLINSGGGLYNNNRIISFQDTDGNGVQDANVANSRQTKPFVSYDAVNQRYFVAWQDGRNGSTSVENLDIYGQFVDLDGTLRGANYSISTASGSQLATTLAYDTLLKQFLAVWKDGRSATLTPSTASDVYGQLFSLGQPQLTLLRTDNTSLAPALLDFGSITAGQTARLSFKIRNTGDTTLAIDCISPAPASPYSIENQPAELNACAEGSSLQLAPSGETTLTVKYIPAAGGTFTGGFTIKSDAGDRTLNLQGIGIPPTMNIIEGDGNSNGTLQYGNVATGQSKNLLLTIVNNSTVSYSITSITGLAAPFALVSPPTFPISMPPSAQTVLTIAYTPTSAGQSSVTMSIVTDKSLSQSVNLDGTGTSGSGSTGITPAETPGTAGTNTPPAASGGGGGGCFIATAAFGSYLDPHVMVLRHFRDNVLLQSELGTAFVKFYYKYSPPIADFIAQHDTLRMLMRLALTPLIFAVKYPLVTAALFFLGVSILIARRVRDKELLEPAPCSIAAE